MYSFNTTVTNIKSDDSKVNDGTNGAKNAQNRRSSEELRLDEFEEELFEGKVALNNWAMTRAQRIVRDDSFESETYNIFNPKFSSGGEETDHDDLSRFEDEEAEGKICDERLSELNPCDYSANESLGDTGSPIRHSHSSNKTQLERCPVDLYDSENLQEDDIRESVAHK